MYTVRKTDRDIRLTDGIITFLFFMFVMLFLPRVIPHWTLQVVFALESPGGHQGRFDLEIIWIFQETFRCFT